MVLQRDRPIHVWGWSDPGEKIAVELHGVSRSATGNSMGTGASTCLPSRPADRTSLTVSANNKIVLDDVLIGDVWFASGQSNMEMPLKGFGGAPLKNSAEEIAHATQPQIRLINFPRKPSISRSATSTPRGPSARPRRPNFSAAAYFFGREVNAREHVPIGLIDATWGGTPGEAWISLQTISTDAALMPVFATRAQMMQSQADAEAIAMAERREDEAARQAGKTPPPHPWRPDPRPGPRPGSSTEWSRPPRRTPSRA
jgi:sialate O-acetylesterase